MDHNHQTRQKLTKQTVGGQAVLSRFFEEILEEQPETVRTIELTYFALTVTTIFYLQYGEQDNKKALIDEVITAVLRKETGRSATNPDLNIETAHQEFKNRLSKYSALITQLLQDDRDHNPIAELVIKFYESATQKSAADKTFSTGKAGTVLSKYIIDNIKYVQREFRTPSPNQG
ncbi:hypothetical protein [Halalkalibaculum sp. DA384]|uniref:hypothetical protein n=1 Tax=Halalkalibaculum sp. DA384 TaxID=3373606 RepID=UPI0037543459